MKPMTSESRSNMAASIPMANLRWSQRPRMTKAPLEATPPCNTSTSSNMLLDITSSKLKSWKSKTMKKSVIVTSTSEDTSEASLSTSRKQWMPKNTPKMLKASSHWLSLIWASFWNQRRRKARTSCNITPKMLRIWRWHTCIRCKSTIKASSTFIRATRKDTSKTWWLNPFKSKLSLIIKISSSTCSRKWWLTFSITNTITQRCIQRRSLDILLSLILRTSYRNACLNMLVSLQLMSKIRCTMISSSTVQARKKSPKTRNPLKHLSIL